MATSILADQFKRSWLFIALPGYRDFKALSTYEAFDFDGLPPIQERFDGSFAWLRSDSLKYPHSIGRSIISTENFVGQMANQMVKEEVIDYIKEDAVSLLSYFNRVGQWLPESFRQLICDEEVYNRIRVCTQAHFDLSVIPAKTKNPSDGYLIRFLVDSQGSPKWYLFVNGEEEFVLVSQRAYGFNAYDRSTWARKKRPEVVDLYNGDLFLCAWSLEEFIFRVWIENEIWYRLAFQKPIEDPRMQLYLSHYKK